jgi:hypothetical protein
VASCGEELANASSFEAILCQPHCSTKPSTSGSNDNGVVFVINCERFRVIIRSGEPSGKTDTQQLYPA